MLVAHYGPATQTRLGPSPRLIIGFTSVVPLVALVRRSVGCPASAAPPLHRARVCVWQVCSLFLPDDKSARCQALRPEGWPLLVVALCTQARRALLAARPQATSL